MEYELYHHGILGMKWGIRRYQNPDGSLTPAGRRRLQRSSERLESAEINYKNASFFNKGKAEQEYRKAKAEHDRFAAKLKYQKMTDEQLIDQSKKFMAEKPTANVATRFNIDLGERSIEDNLKLYNSIVTAGSNTANLVNSIRQIITNTQLSNQTMQINERKQSLAERESRERRSDSLRDYADRRADAARDYADRRADAARDYADRRTDAAREFIAKRTDADRDYTIKSATAATNAYVKYYGKYEDDVKNGRRKKGS